MHFSKREVLEDDIVQSKEAFLVCALDSSPVERDILFHFVREHGAAVRNVQHKGLDKATPSQRLS
jgi:hypothetical protein